MTHSSDTGDATRAPGTPTKDALMQAQVLDAGGRPASVVSIEYAGQDALAWVRAGNSRQGTQVRVPVSMMTAQPDGAYRLPFSFDDSPGPDGNMRLTFRVRQEQLAVGKRVVDTGRGVRIHKTVSQREHIVDPPLLRDELQVEHIPVGAIVAGSDPPRMRYEGDTLVVPVLEEVLVVQKQLRLKEELRITRHRRPAHAPQSVPLRSEHVDVERFDEDADQGKGGVA